MKQNKNIDGLSFNDYITNGRISQMPWANSNDPNTLTPMLPQNIRLSTAKILAESNTIAN
jgi:hypothetical protein